jgi:hypothetical protein
MAFGRKSAPLDLACALFEGTGHGSAEPPPLPHPCPSFAGSRDIGHRRQPSGLASGLFCPTEAAVFVALRDFNCSQYRELSPIKLETAAVAGIAAAGISAASPTALAVTHNSCGWRKPAQVNLDVTIGAAFSQAGCDTAAGLAVTTPTSDDISGFFSRQSVPGLVKTRFPT